MFEVLVGIFCVIAVIVFPFAVINTLYDLYKTFKD